MSNSYTTPSTLSKSNLDSVFHAYDIRGRDPEELDEVFYETLGMAFVTFLNAKKIVIGRDIRKSGEKYKQAFIKGATSQGADVIDIGEIATEMLYYAVGSDKSIDGGVTITASHNPSGWNGCKMVGSGASPLSGDYGLPEIKKLMLDNSFELDQNRQGKVTKIDIYPEFKAKVLSFLGDTEIKPLKIVVDAGNGIGGKIFDYVFGDLNLEVKKMFFEPDDAFPNHVPNPMEEENIAQIKKETVSSQADIGIAIDGDADRVFFVDNKGRNPSGIYTGAIYATHFLKDNPGANIIQDPRITWPVTNEVQKAGGKTVMIKAGHSFFKHHMKESNAIFGAEASCHFYYRDFFNADSGMITIALILKMLSNGLDFDETLDYYYSTYPNSGEVNFEVDDPNATYLQIEEYFKTNYPEAIITKIDGISIELPTWRFNLRGSNTQPLIRLNLEAKDKDTIVKNYILLKKLIAGRQDNTPSMKELLTL